MRRLILTLGLVMLASTTAMAQVVVKDTVDVPGFFESGEYGTLNAAIDAARTAGTINNTVFRLTPFDQYVLTASIFIDHGESLDIYAPKPTDDPESAPPQIVWTEDEIDREYIIQTYGDVRLQNVWLRYADVFGNRIMTGVVFEDQRPEAGPEEGYFDGVIFDYAGIGSESGGSVTVKADRFRGTFLNSYFRNNGDVHFQYYGRAVSFPYQSSGWHYEYLLFENTTFANISRIVMMEGNSYGAEIHLNHVTILNTVENIIQSGWNRDLSITNSIIVNPYMMGYRAADVCDTNQSYNDFLNGLCDDPNGALFNITPVDSFGFDVDFTDADRKIFVGHNNYMYQDWFLDWMEECDNICLDRIRQRERDLLPNPYPALSVGAIAFIDSVDAEGNKVFNTLNVDWDTMYEIDPGFIVPATNQDSLKIFMENKWDDNADIDWSYMESAALAQRWPLPENLAYTNEVLNSAAMGGFPLGDLNWYPEVLPAWEAQREQEWEQIFTWLNEGLSTSTEPGHLRPDGFSLGQNYPNPFSAATRIAFTVPEAGVYAMKVYNALGQQVATVFEGMQSAGTHEVNFDSGSLSNGVYFYRLEGESGPVATRKFTVIR